MSEPATDLPADLPEETRAAVETLTAEVLASFDEAPERLRALMQGLVRHLHDFVLEQDLTQEEWRAGIDFLTRAGHITTDVRQEFILLSDTLGVSSLVDVLSNSRTPDSTPSAVLGPFYVEDPPELPDGADITGDLEGDRVAASITVTDTSGAPVPGAVVDVWQSDEDGFYDVQRPELDEALLRARFRTDASGGLRFTTTLPAPYSIPADGPVGQMLVATGRHPMRAPHVHFMISAAGKHTLVTQLFVEGGDYLDSDTVFGVKDPIIVPFPEDAAGGRRLEFTFVLADDQGGREMTEEDTFDTDVLVVGSGPAGGTMAALLATYGVSCRMVTKYGWVANSPRAHITNQRAMEVFRDLGIEELALRDGTPSALMGDTVFATSLTGTEIGRIRTWGTGDESLSEYAAQSPCQMIDLPQTYLEPILLQTAASRGAEVSFDTELIGLSQDDEGVTGRLRDRRTGVESTCRARYLVGADGGRSLVAATIGLPIEGQMGKAGSMNIVFRADLSALVAHRPSILYWIMRPGADIGGIGMGVVRMVRPWDHWLLIWGYDIDGPPPEVTAASATAVVRDLVGDPDLEVEIESADLWTVNHAYATAYSSGRVFCVGDAVHRHPPSNGLGSNTSVQDSANLAWKLACVLRGEAGAGLLGTYSDERAPIGRQVVERANLSIEQFGPLFEALGLVGGAGGEEGIAAALASASAPTAEGAATRAAIQDAIALKHYEFNAHGVEHNQRYESGAVVPDGPAEQWDGQDGELFARATSRPGAKLPHAWLVAPDGRRVSTLDLVGHGQFSVLTGLSGTAWTSAAGFVAAELGVPLRIVVVDGDAHDAYGEWHRRREIAEDGVLLVRPDGYVAWRQVSGVTDPIDAVGLLRDALSTVLGRSDLG